MRVGSATAVSRRQLLMGGFGVAAAGVLAACADPPLVDPTSSHLPEPSTQPAQVTPRAGQRVVSRSLTAAPLQLDLGGRKVATWGYNGQLPGPLLRATAGDLLRVTLDNRLPAETTIHWHGIRLRNVADGVPGLTQDPVARGARYRYEFVAPDPGTYFFHPHVGLQLDRGLYAPLIIDDPHESGRYDAEWVVVLDDWLDGTGTTPDAVLQQLISDGGSDSSGGMGAMMEGGMGAAPWGSAGDVQYPLFLLNGRPPNDPEVFKAKPGQRIRLRVINAASDTIFSVALGGHRLTLTHTDGFAVQPQEVSAFWIGMGERYDAIVTVRDAVAPLIAKPFGKTGGGQGFALLRTASGSAPPATISLPELAGEVFVGSELLPAESAKLPPREPDSTLDLTLQGSMRPYQWVINGAAYGKNDPLQVSSGQRLRLNALNMSMMTHPLHVHGHTFALPSGLRKDTVLLAHMQSLSLDVEANNPGNWMVHCHNAYHAEAGMMIALKYVD